MEKLQIIKHSQFGQLSVIVIDGKEYFKAKECAVMLGYSNLNDAISRHCKGVVKHDLPTKSGKQTVNLISEGDLWRLIIRSKLPQAEEIEKWIMEEVLPSIRKSGSYSMPHKDKQLELYEYFDKTYNGEPVLSIADVSHLTGINRTAIREFIHKSLTIGFDFYLLKKSELEEFKAENPKVSKLSSCMFVITKEGFDMICKAYNIKLETPKLFIEEKPQRNDNKVMPSKGMYSLMGYVQRSAAEIQYYSLLLLTADKKANHEEYRKKLAKAIRSIRCYAVDVETIRI